MTGEHLNIRIAGAAEVADCKELHVQKMEAE